MILKVFSFVEWRVYWFMGRAPATIDPPGRSGGGGGGSSAVSYRYV